MAAGDTIPNVRLEELELSDSDSEISGDEFLKRLDHLEANQNKISQLLQEQCKGLREELEDMRKHIREQEAKKQRKLKARYRKLKRQSMPGSVGVDHGPDRSASDEPNAARRSTTKSETSVCSQSPDSVNQQLVRETRQSSTLRSSALNQDDEPMPLAPPLSPAPVSLKDGKNDKSLSSEKLTPAPTAPVANMGGMVISATHASKPDTMVPQRAKCSIKRGKRRGMGTPSSNSRKQGDIEGLEPTLADKSPSRTSVGMAKRSKPPRGSTGMTRADFAATKNESLGAFTPVNKKDLGSSKIFNLKNKEKPPETLLPLPSKEKTVKRPSTGIPDDPILFNQKDILMAFGGGKLTGPIWKLPPHPQNLLKDNWSYLVVVSDASNVEIPTRSLEGGALLDLHEWEFVGSLKINHELDFPVFVRIATDRYLFCGIYEFGEWDVVSLGTWKGLPEHVQSYWVKHVVRSETGANMLEEKNLKPRCSEEEAHRFFGSQLINEKKALRLSRTEISPKHFSNDIYDALSGFHEESGEPYIYLSSFSGADGSGGSKRPAPDPRPVRKRLRIEEQPADHDTVHFPLSKSATPITAPASVRSPRLRQGIKSVKYDLAEMSRNSLADTGLGSSSSEDGEQKLQREKKGTGRKKALRAGRIVMDEESEEE